MRFINLMRGGGVPLSRLVGRLQILLAMQIRIVIIFVIRIR